MAIDKKTKDRTNALPKPIKDAVIIMTEAAFARWENMDERERSLYGDSIEEYLGHQMIQLAGILIEDD